MVLKLYNFMKDGFRKKNVILQKILFKVQEASSLHLGSTGHLMGMNFLRFHNFLFLTVPGCLSCFETTRINKST